jgi:flagellar protein FliS
MIANPLQSYKTISLQTAPPGQSILMLYEGAIKFLERARMGLELDDPLEMNETVHNNITRAQDIINELHNTLDMEQGGKLAVVLSDLYAYLERRLFESNIRKDEAGIVEVIDRLTTLQEGWAEMLEQQSVTA